MLQTLEPLLDSPGVLFLRGLARLPVSQAAHLHGKALYESGDFEAAAAVLSPCPALDCRRELGKVLVSQRQGEAAAARYYEAVERERPNDPNLFYQLMRAYQAAGNAARATKL